MATDFQLSENFHYDKDFFFFFLKDQYDKDLPHKASILGPKKKAAYQ